MSQITKTITKIHVSPEEMAGYKAAEINSRIETFAAQVEERADALLVWAKNSNVQSTWTYMANKDVFYIPQIVGVMPNLEIFDASFQKGSNSSFQMPDAEYMNFAGFAGDFPTEHEAAQCLQGEAYCIHREYGSDYIRVKGRNFHGITVKYRNAFAIYNIYSGRNTVRYGDDSGSYYGWNIPIYRFNGKNSSPVSIGKTILYWLTYNLRPAPF